MSENEKRKTEERRSKSKSDGKTKKRSEMKETSKHHRNLHKSDTLHIASKKDREEKERYIKEKSTEKNEHQRTVREDGKNHRRSSSKSRKKSQSDEGAKKKHHSNSSTKKLRKADEQILPKESVSKEDLLAYNAKPSTSKIFVYPTVRNTSITEGKKDSNYNYVNVDGLEEYADEFEEDSEEEEIPVIENITQVSYESKSHERSSKTLNISESPLLSRLLQSRDANFRPRTLSIPNTNTEIPTRDRYSTLQNLLGMEVTYFEFADIPPVSDYEFYIQMFGKTDKVQVQTQTHDDDCHRFVQTEEDETESKWTQHPPTDERGWGIGSAKRIEFASSDLLDADIDYYRKRKIDIEGLKKFLDVAGEVIIELTNVPSTSLAASELKYQSKISHSSGYSRFSLESITDKSQVSNVVYHQGNLFIAFFVTEGKNKEILGKTVVAQFAVNDSTIPQRQGSNDLNFSLMTCENEISCACFVVSRLGALFAGLKDGSCVAFDLSEPLHLFASEISWPNVEKPFPLCTPAYDTAFQSVGSEEDDDMRSPVVGINATRTISARTLSYQVASINELGTIFVWTITEVEEKSPVVDLGLRPGARLKMSLTSIIRLSAAGSSQRSGLSSLNVRCVTYDPNDPFHFFIGTDNRVIFNFTRAKGWSYTGPQVYKTQGLPSEITCETFSPFDIKIFLAGLSNGQLLFFKVDRAQPVLALDHPTTEQASVTQVEFSPSIATVFYALYENRYLYQWNLANGKNSTLNCDILKCYSATVVCTAIWPQIRHHEACQNFLAIGLSNGELQVHGMKNDSYTNRKTDLWKSIATINE